MANIVGDFLGCTLFGGVTAGFIGKYCSDHRNAGIKKLNFQQAAKLAAGAVAVGYVASLIFELLTFDASKKKSKGPELAPVVVGLGGLGAYYYFAKSPLNHSLVLAISSLAGAALFRQIAKQF